MPNDAQPASGHPDAPIDLGNLSPPANDVQPLPRATTSSQSPVTTPDAQQEMCALKVGQTDERGNTVKYIYACDADYVVYYSRLEHRAAQPDGGHRNGATSGRRWFPRIGRLSGRPVADAAYESEGVQAQLSPDPSKRPEQRHKLLPLGTDRAKLQALLGGWPRRQSYDTSIATALQLALDGDGTDASSKNALETLSNARASIMSEREISGRAQYVRFTLMSGFLVFLLLVFAQHNVFKASGNFWLGTQAGLVGAVLSIAFAIRKRTVALDTSVAGNLTDSLLRLIIGAVSGGTLVLLFSTGLLPPLQTRPGGLTVDQSVTFAMLLGILAGFVEQLVPSMLEDQGKGLGGGGGAKPPTDGAR